MGKALSSVYSAERENGAKLQKSFLLPVAKVNCDWNENIRPLNAEHIERWVSTLEQGDFVPAILVEMREGEPWVIEGFHRHTAVAQHTPDGLIECKEWRGDAVDKKVTMRNSTTGLPLTFLQDAELIHQIKTESNLSATALGKRLGMSHTAVNNKVLIAECCDEVKKLISEGAVSATTVIEVVTEHGHEKALARIEHLLKRANKAGKTRVTAGSGGTKAFSAAKFRAALELLSKGLDYEDFIEDQNELGDGEVDLELTLDKEEMLELIDIIEDYVEHTA